MRLVILTNSQSNQRALAHKIASGHEIAAIVVSRNIPRRKPGLQKRGMRLINTLGNRTAGKELVEAWKQMLSRYDEEFARFPNGQMVEVDNVNDQATLATIKENSPCLVVVSGTNIVGTLVIATAEQNGAMINLHTGISPYVKGGPNCTNWCLARNWFHLIGNSVMWIDRGVDSGALIATERTPLNGSEDLNELHWKVMEHAHDLYVRAISRYFSGEQLPKVVQSEIGEGVEFRSHEWDRKEMARSINNFKMNYRDFFANTDAAKLTGDLKLVEMER